MSASDFDNKPTFRLAFAIFNGDIALLDCRILLSGGVNCSALKNRQQGLVRSAERDENCDMEKIPCYISYK